MTESTAHGYSHPSWSRSAPQSRRLCCRPGVITPTRSKVPEAKTTRGLPQEGFELGLDRVTRLSPQVSSQIQGVRRVPWDPPAGPCRPAPCMVVELSALLLTGSSCSAPQLSPVHAGEKHLDEDGAIMSRPSSATTHPDSIISEHVSMRCSESRKRDELHTCA